MTPHAVAVLALLACWKDLEGSVLMKLPRKNRGEGVLAIVVVNSASVKMLFLMPPDSCGAQVPLPTPPAYEVAGANRQYDAA